MSEYEGRLFVISGPSGAGKSTVLDEVFERSAPRFGDVKKDDVKAPQLPQTAFR